MPLALRFRKRYKISINDTMNKIEEAQKEIVEDFSDITDWMDKYAYIIDLGNSLPPLPEELKKPEYLIEGCQSRAWLNAELDSDGNVCYRADSDAIIVKGIISLLIKVLSGNSPEDILNSDLKFIEEIGLSDHLSPTRSNGLLSMIRQMRLYAMAFKELKEKQQSNK